MAAWEKGHYIPDLQNSMSPSRRVGSKEKVTDNCNTVKELIVTKLNCIGELNIQNMIGFG